MEIFFPKNLHCISCEQHISIKNKYSLCKKCYDNLKRDVNICNRCGRVIGEHNICFECENEIYNFDGVYSAVLYNDILHHMIYKYKYGYGTYLGEYFGALINEKIKKLNIKFDGITFVPLSKKRLGNRGYNQGELLAMAVSLGTKVPIHNLLRRTKDTKFMAKLSGVQRFREVKGVFGVLDSEIDVKDKNIIIVDDIFTTGATTNEMAKVLKENFGLEKVFVVTLANARIRRE